MGVISQTMNTYWPFFLGVGVVTLFFHTVCLWVRLKASRAQEFAAMAESIRVKTNVLKFSRIIRMDEELISGPGKLTAAIIAAKDLDAAKEILINISFELEGVLAYEWK